MKLKKRQNIIIQSYHITNIIILQVLFIHSKGRKNRVGDRLRAAAKSALIYAVAAARKGGTGRRYQHFVCWETNRFL